MDGGVGGGTVITGGGGIIFAGLNSIHHRLPSNFFNTTENTTDSSNPYNRYIFEISDSLFSVFNINSLFGLIFF